MTDSHKPLLTPPTSTNSCLTDLHLITINFCHNNLGENIADGGGIHQAYRTYKRWLTSQKSNTDVLEGEMLPELNLTSTQLFFLSFGQVW